MCNERGLPCGKKYLGSEDRNLLCGQPNKLEADFCVPRPVPLDESMKSLDLRHFEAISIISGVQIQHLNGVVHEKYTKIHITNTSDINGSVFHVTGCDVVSLPWPKFSLSSKSFLFAALAFVSLRDSKGELTNEQTFNYLSKFYHHVRESIQQGSIVEVIVACYTIILFHCRTIFDQPDSFESMLIHFGGMCKAIIASGEDNRSNFGDLCDAAFHVLQHIYWARAQPDPQDLRQELQLLENVYAVFQNFAELHMYPPLSSVRDSGIPLYTSATRFHKRSLCVYLDCYLALRKEAIIDQTRSWRESTITIALHQTLRQIQLESETQNVRLGTSVFPLDDAKAVLLCGFATLLEQALFMPSNPTSELVQSADALYNVCQAAILLNWSNHSSMPMTRYLFWIGLVLTKNVNHIGKFRLYSDSHITANEWIFLALKAQLTMMISVYSFESTDLIENVFGLLFQGLEKANALSYGREVFNLDSNNFDLFGCNRMMEKLLI